MKRVRERETKRKIVTGNLNILVGFYNLRIKPNVSSNTSRIVNERDKPRILRFLHRNANFDIARLKVRASLVTIGEGIPATGEPLINDALEKYRQVTQIDWFESEHFRRLMEIYQMTRQTIDDLLSNHYHHYIHDWLTQLWRELEKPKLKRKLDRVKDDLETLQQRFPFEVRIKESIEKEARGEQNLDELTILEELQIRSQMPNTWEVLMPNHIGEAIYEAFDTILNRAVLTHLGIPIKRCELSDCHRIFSLLNPNASLKRWCSGSCRVKAHRIKNEDKIEN